MVKRLNLRVIILLILFLFFGAFLGLLSFKNDSDVYKSSAQVVFVDKTNSCPPQKLQIIAFSSLEKLQPVLRELPLASDYSAEIASGISGINIYAYGYSSASSSSKLNTLIENMVGLQENNFYDCQNVSFGVDFPQSRSVIFQSKRALWIDFSVGILVSVIAFCFTYLIFGKQINKSVKII